MANETTIGRYLIDQLHSHGVQHIFGIPGDYTLLFIEALLKSPVAFLNTCDEQGAGFAADAYARLHGLGAVCVTYAVGSLKVANATAQAFVERSPLVVICGAPGLQERKRHPLLHHLVNQFDTQLQVFRQITAYAVALDNPETACAEIDRALHTAERQKRPVYIEIPRDFVNMPGRDEHQHRDEPELVDEEILHEALAEAAAMLTAAERPVIIAGPEIKRFNLHDTLRSFAEQSGIPIVATMQGKSVVSECFPLYLGFYAGAIGSADVARYVEESDCQLLLGAQQSDINMGMFTANLDRARMIIANTDEVAIRHHFFDVRMGQFLQALLQAAISKKPTTALPRPAPQAPYIPEAERTITVQRLFQRLGTFITDETVVLAEIGDSLFGALDMPICREGGFLSTAYYSNMGFAVPGSLGVQALDRTLRPLVIVGDGAFQMTGMELSTAAHYGFSPIVVVLNNQGYATERFFLDGPFNDLQPWNFSRIPEVVNAGLGFSIHTEGELEHALLAAASNTGSFSILDVHIALGDVSESLKKLGARFGKTVRG